MDVRSWKEMFDTMWEIHGTNFIQFLLYQNIDINALDRHGTTFLSYAAECGNIEVVEILVQNGADANARNSNGSIPLHLAAKHGRQTVVKFFLNLGISGDTRDDDGNTPLRYILNGWMDDRTLESVRELVHLLRNGKAIDEEEYTPLILGAGIYAYADLVKHFIHTGASVDCCSPLQLTFLGFCYDNLWPDILSLLIRKDSDIDRDARNARGLTPLVLADEFFHDYVIKLILEAGDEVTDNLVILCYACQCGMLDPVKEYVGKVRDLNAKASTGHTPLFLAVAFSHLSVVEFLIESGADVNCTDNCGRTPLHIACALGSLRVAQALIKAGCDLNAQDQSRDTPLHAAIRVCKLESVRILLEAGADVNVQNAEGTSAFVYFLLSTIMFQPGIDFFLKNGACIQSKDYAVISEDPSLKKVILQDLNFCTQAFINIVNADLRKIYKIPGLSKCLPPVEQLNIVNKTSTAQDIAQSVSYKIETEGHCNVLKLCPLNLAILSVKSLVKYYCA